MRVKPVGASTIGIASGLPSNVEEMSTSPTSRSTRGANSTLRNAATFDARVTSSSAPPSM